MHTQSKSAQRLHASRGLAMTISLAFLFGIAAIDYITGRETSFTLLYLLPVSIAAWFIGPRAGIVMSVAAAVCGLVIGLAGERLLAVAFWNAGAKFGVYLTFSTLLSYLKTHHAGMSVLRTLNRTIMMTVACAVLLALVGAVLQRQFPTAAALLNSDSASLPASKPSSALVALAVKVDETLKTSRPVMLGSRDPSGPSCVAIIKTGDVKDAVPNNPGDWNGGPGTTMATLYYFDRQNNKSPMQDFEWHQHRLKTYLENEAAIKAVAAKRAHELAGEALRFYETTNAWSAVPNDL